MFIFLGYFLAKGGEARLKDSGKQPESLAKSLNPGAEMNRILIPVLWLRARLYL
jgi:hypothetical protein